MSRLQAFVAAFLFLSAAIGLLLAALFFGLVFAIVAVIVSAIVMAGWTFSSLWRQWIMKLRSLRGR